MRSLLKKSLAIVSLCSATAAFGQPPFVPFDHKGEAPSTGMSYFRNDGQVATLNGLINSQVRYYSWGGYPRVAAKRQSTVSLNLEAVDTLPATPDWNFAIEFRPVGELAADVTPVALEEITEKHNFFLAHCPQGVVNVPGHKRVVYESIYPYIDMHLYSNQFGLKVYFVLRPGANAQDILLQFTGQDSIRYDFTGAMKLFIDERFVRMPEALAYQQINGETELVSWGLNYDPGVSEELVGFNFESYDPNYPLVLDISASLGAPPSFGLPPEWGTYYGDAGQDQGVDMLTLTNGGQLYCGSTRSPMFPLTGGAFQTQLLGITDGFLSYFTNQYHREYATFYGGSGHDAFAHLAVTPDQQHIYLSGSSTSTDIPLTSFSPDCFQDDSNPYRSAMLVRFPIYDMSPDPAWQTYFGSYSMVAPDLDVDAQGNLYLAGTIFTIDGYADELTCQGTSDSYPLCNAIGGTAFFQDHFGGGGRDAYFAKFNPLLELVHSTLVGGNEEDGIYSLAVDDASQQVFFTGYTTSVRQTYTNCQATSNGGYPLCDPGSGYFQFNLNGANDPSTNYIDGTVGSFSTVDGRMTWSSFVGGYDHELMFDVVPDGPNAKVYFTGVTYTPIYGANNCEVTTNGGFPCCHMGPQHYQEPGGAADAVIMKFDIPTHDLVWSTMVGSEGPDGAGALGLTTNEMGETHLLMLGSTNSGTYGTEGITTLSHPDYYYQAEHADAASDTIGSDMMLLVFDESDERLLSTYIGGWGPDYGSAVAGSGGERIYLTGSSTSTQEFPFNCPPTLDPYCNMSYLNISTDQNDVFHLQIQYDATVGLEDAAARVATSWSLFPNPVDRTTTLTATKFIPNDLRLSLFDVLGRMTDVDRRHVRTTGQAISLDLSELPPGCWLVRLASVEGSLNMSLPLIKR